MRQEDSLLAAVQSLEQSRAEWTERKAAYAAVRTAAKRAGQRVPPASLTTVDRLVADQLGSTPQQRPADADEIRHLAEALRRRQAQRAFQDAPRSGSTAGTC